MRFRCSSTAIVLALALPTMSWAVDLYTEDFEDDAESFWTINGGPSDEAADFAFDYGASAGIPLAPNSVAGTSLGLKLQVNQSSGIFGGFSVSPIGQNFSGAGDYKVTFDWWANANGPFPAGGSGSTQLSTFGIGTAGTAAQWPGGIWDSVYFGATGEGGSSNDWRAYSRGAVDGNGDPAAAGSIWPEDSGVYAAGNTDSPTNASNAYYGDNGFGGNAAPAAQVTLYPQQTGTTQAGAAGMEWHQVEIIKTSTEVKWIVSGVPIATIPLSEAVTMGGGNIFFGQSDVNDTSSSDPNDVALLFTLIDNVKVSTIEAPPANTADFNGDTVIDAADYVVWRTHDGLMGGATQSQGDANGDMNVDETDYGLWRAAFGEMIAGSGSSGANVSGVVPEPSAIVLLFWSIVALAALRRELFAKRRFH